MYPSSGLFSSHLLLELPLRLSLVCKLPDLLNCRWPPCSCTEQLSQQESSSPSPHLWSAPSSVAAGGIDRGTSDEVVKESTFVNSGH